MDEVSLYNRALSQSEIQTIYNADGLGKCVLRLWCVPDAFTVPTNTPTNFSAAKLTLNDVLTWTAMRSLVTGGEF